MNDTFLFCRTVDSLDVIQPFIEPLEDNERSIFFDKLYGEGNFKAWINDENRTEQALDDICKDIVSRV